MYIKVTLNEFNQCNTWFGIGEEGLMHNLYIFIYQVYIKIISHTPFTFVFK